MSKSKDRTRSPKHPKGTASDERAVPSADARSDEERKPRPGTGEVAHKHEKRFGHN
jgi:hypothetical protein